MSDDLTKEMQDILNRSHKRKEEEDKPAEVVLGNIGSNNTVVIGNGNNLGRRSEDRPGGKDEDASHGRRASDRKVYKEIRQLRRQIKSLRCSIERLQKKQEQCLVTPENTDPESGFKQPLKARSQTTSKCRKPSVQSADFCPIYMASLFSDTGSTDCSETRATIDSVPFNLIHSRIIPFVPHHLTAHRYRTASE